MNQPREHPGGEALHSIALRVLGLPDHEDSACRCSECTRARDDLRALTMLLEDRSARLFVGEVERPTTRFAGPVDSSAASSRRRSSHSPGWLLATIAAATLAAVVGLILWMSNLEPIISRPDSWRSEAMSPPEVTVQLEGDVVRIQWPGSAAATWYRVSVVEASGRLLALRDLDQPCGCEVEVSLREPPAVGPVYFLLEAFDSEWNRAWTHSGRVVVTDR